MGEEFSRRISFEKHRAVVALGRFSSTPGREALNYGVGVLNHCGFTGQIAQRASVSRVFVTEDFSGSVLQGGRGAEYDVGNLADVGCALTVEEVFRRVVHPELRLRGLNQSESAKNGGGSADEMLGICELFVNWRQDLRFLTRGLLAEVRDVLFPIPVLLRCFLR